VADRHEAHDLLLVAAFAAGDLEVGDLALAEALVGACDQCATLAADLRAISRATAEIPVPRRPRDFFVRPDDAERLRPNRLRRLAAAIAGPRAQLARPFAGGLMMIGFAGLLVASLPGLGGPASVAPADRRLESLASPMPDSEIQGGPAAPGASGEPAATDETLGEVRDSAGQGASLRPVAGGPPASAPAAEPGPIKTSREAARDAVAGPSGLVIGSAALVAIGAVLFLASLLRPGPRRS
jgi:hypothetical protein